MFPKAQGKVLGALANCSASILPGRWQSLCFGTQILLWKMSLPWKWSNLFIYLYTGRQLRASAGSGVALSNGALSIMAHNSRTSSAWLHRAHTSRHFLRELASSVCWIWVKSVLAISGFNLIAHQHFRNSICTMETQIHMHHRQTSQSMFKFVRLDPESQWLPTVRAHHLLSLLAPSHNWACERE